MKKILTILYNIFLFILVIYITQSITFNFVVNKFWKMLWNTMLVTQKNVNVIWNNKNNEQEIIKTITTTNNNTNNNTKLSEIDYIKVWNKEILVRKADWSNLIWANFLTYEKVDWHIYLYAHNGPSTRYYMWDYLNKKLKIWDIIVLWNIADWKEKKYQLYNTQKIPENLTKNNNKNIIFENKNDILFFTCVEWWKKRKIFLFREIN